MEISSTVTILGAISKAIEIVNGIRNSKNPPGKAEMELQFATALSALVDAKLEISNVLQQLQEKEQQINDLKEQISVKGNTQFETPFYWIIDGSRRDGPYCQACYDEQNKYIRLYNYGENWWQCKTCKNTYEGSA